MYSDTILYIPYLPRREPEATRATRVFFLLRPDHQHCLLGGAGCEALRKSPVGWIQMKARQSPEVRTIAILYMFRAPLKTQLAPFLASPCPKRVFVSLRNRSFCFQLREAPKQEVRFSQFPPGHSDKESIFMRSCPILFEFLHAPCRFGPRCGVKHGTHFERGPNHDTSSFRFCTKWVNQRPKGFAHQ